MRYDQIDAALVHSVGRQVKIALLVGVLLLGGAGGVAALAQISGAVVGMGKLIVEGRWKEIQHLEGGTVAEIRVAEGDAVEKGQVLFRLDPTTVEARLGIIQGQIDTLLAKEARLQAELAGAADIETSPALRAAGTPQADALLRGQADLMRARAAARAGRENQLGAQIAQLEEKVVALRAQKRAAAQSMEIAAEEVETRQRLSDSNLLRASDLRDAKRSLAELQAEDASLDARILEAREEITGRQYERALLDETFREEALTELDEIRDRLAQLRQEEIGAMDSQRRLSVRAPIGGRLHELSVHTLGQVVAPGERLVTIIPGDDRLIVEMRLDPQSVDQVYPGQAARLRFTGLDQRTTPQLGGAVIDISPDASTDEGTGQTFYLARLQIAEDELGRIDGAVLRPGMPLEVFVQTQERSILSYLVKPMVDQVQHAMRER
ncbi:HlyD family secretion protein [Palleronia aestuarii]|uniref:Membrane fusion protein (MFP) family protein n=1 Tax=Palleronia aestuarii TaxID=568105 RepID=A0A2W7NP99_9RHOB|nr:HlyD family type I secretion periplasmic adaptor subunit [Palleronia aestuarii]PZX13102.1 HlyD family secretion protein [Palleronia aestuarii]